MRPANIFGPEDRFLNWFAVAAQYLRFYPLLYGGETLVQPVYADDVAKALMEIVWVRFYFSRAQWFKLCNGVFFRIAMISLGRISILPDQMSFHIRKSSNLWLM